MRKEVAGLYTSAGVWKATEHKVVGGPFNFGHLEATPDALWVRTDPFGTYRLAGERGDEPKPPAHQIFSKLADMAPGFSVSGEKARKFSRLVEVFADTYGLLGLLREDLGTPLLPGSRKRVAALVAPDAMIDKTGRLHDIDPATDGKRLLEELIVELDRQDNAERGDKHLWKRKELDLSRRVLIWPEELRFQKPAMDFSRPRFAWELLESSHDEIYTYEDAQRRYGVRVVFDPWADAGVSILSTREPLGKWRDELRGFAGDISWEDLDRRLEGGIRPRAVPGKDRRVAEHWYCATLLKALYLMRYLDLNSGTKMLKCQAPDCLEYFRVGPRSRPRKYCPPPPGKKESRCTSRASSAMYRERRRSDGA